MYFDVHFPVVLQVLQNTACVQSSLSLLLPLLTLIISNGNRSLSAPALSLQLNSAMGKSRNKNLQLSMDFTRSGSRDAAVVRALAFYQCGPGSIPGLGVICGMSLLLVLVLAPRVFSPGTPVFPSPQKPTLLNFNSIWKVSCTCFNERFRS